MIFTIFRDFSGFFWIFPDFFRFNFYLKTFKNKYKKCKIRAGPTRLRRGTQGHVAEPRGPAQRLHGAIHIYLFIYYSIKGVFSLPYMGRVINPLDRRVL